MSSQPTRKTTMRAKVTWVSPQHAKEALRNKRNIRKANPSKVAQILSDIKLGDWEDNGETAKYWTDPKDGKEWFVDAQNRYEAIAKSGKGQWIVVVRGIQGAKYVDIGEKRTLPQLLHSEGVPYANNMASCVSNLLAYDAFSKGSLDASGSRRVSHSTRIHTFEHFRKRLMKFVPMVHNIKHLRWRGTLAAIMVLGTTTRDYGAAKDEFLECLSTGEDLARNDACRVLREFQINSARRMIRHTQRHRIAIATMAWNWHRTLQLMPTDKFTFVETGPTPTKFPKIQ